jgi:hypothetical protein
MKALKIQKNLSGKKIALVQKGEGFAVYVLCANYAGHCRGGIAYSWRVAASGLSMESAEALFVKRVSGRK